MQYFPTSPHFGFSTTCLIVFCTLCRCGDSGARGRRRRRQHGSSSKTPRRGSAITPLREAPLFDPTARTAHAVRHPLRHAAETVLQSDASCSQHRRIRLQCPAAGQQHHAAAEFHRRGGFRHGGIDSSHNPLASISLPKSGVEIGLKFPSPLCLRTKLHRVSEISYPCQGYFLNNSSSVKHGLILVILGVQHREET